jgi:hypothetical protein
MEKRLWLKKPTIVKNVRAVIQAKEVVDIKAGVAVATRAEAAAEVVAVATSVVMTTAVAVAETTTVVVAAPAEKAVVAVETVGNLKQKNLKKLSVILLMAFFIPF